MRIKFPFSARATSNLSKSKCPDGGGKGGPKTTREREEDLVRVVPLYPSFGQVLHHPTGKRQLQNGETTILQKIQVFRGKVAKTASEYKKYIRRKSYFSWVMRVELVRREEETITEKMEI